MNWCASVCQILTNFGRKKKNREGNKMKIHKLCTKCRHVRDAILVNYGNRNWLPGLFLWPLLLYVDELHSYAY